MSKRAARLQVGDVFIGPDGEQTMLFETHREEHPEGIAVYNFEVDDTSNYYVIANYEAYLAGAEPVLVHNGKLCNGKDFATNQTVNLRQYFRSEGEARNMAMRVIGRKSIKLPDHKIRSQNGKWQYRAKPEDVAGLHGEGPHIHLGRVHIIIIEKWSACRWYRYEDYKTTI